MAEITPLSDNLNKNDFDKQRLPAGLNILTILTIIWCCLSFLFAIGGFITAKSKYDNRDADLEKMTQVPAFVKAIMPSPENYSVMVTKSNENKIPILVLGLIAVALCFAGALQMRKRKKQGYLLYMVGELLPFLTTVIFIGSFTLTGIGAMIFSGIVLLFIILYTVQRKHLIY